MPGRVAIDKDRCKGCTYCVVYCPKKCIELSADLNKRGVHYAVFVKPQECISCRICADVCPDLCIEVNRKMVGHLYKQVGGKLTEIMDKIDKMKSDDPPFERGRSKKKKNT